MWSNPNETADLVTFTEEILNGKLLFLCSSGSSRDSLFNSLMHNVPQNSQINFNLIYCLILKICETVLWHFCLVISPGFMHIPNTFGFDVIANLVQIGFYLLSGSFRDITLLLFVKWVSWKNEITWLFTKRNEFS